VFENYKKTSIINSRKKGVMKMLDKFIPDLYQKSIYTIDYDKLKLRGIKVLIFDLDNTIVPIFEDKPSRKSMDLFEKLKKKGFKIFIMSNSNQKRLIPFKEMLEVDCAFSSKKPFLNKFKKIIEEFEFKLNEMVIIGDQVVTDVFGGNRFGITTILVDKIHKKGHFLTHFTRGIEKLIMFSAKRKKIFSKGNYYE